MLIELRANQWLFLYLPNGLVLYHLVSSGLFNFFPFIICYSLIFLQMQTVYNYLLKPLLTGGRGPLLNFYFCVVPLFHLLHCKNDSRENRLPNQTAVFFEMSLHLFITSWKCPPWPAHLLRLIPVGIKPMTFQLYNCPANLLGLEKRLPLHWESSVPILQLLFHIHFHIVWIVKDTRGWE